MSSIVLRCIKSIFHDSHNMSRISYLSLDEARFTIFRGIDIKVSNFFTVDRFADPTFLYCDGGGRPFCPLILEILREPGGDRVPGRKFTFNC